MELKKNQIVTLEITGLTSEGSGVSRLNGMVIFVPFTALGDKIEAKILKVTKSCCYGKIERIITPSPDRTEVDCSVFGKCGGCVYRHISYEAELRAKEQSVKDAFERIGGLSPEFLPIVPNENTERYRNKAQYPVAKNADGKAVYGFFAANSHRIIPCHDCKLQPEIFSEIATAVTEFAAENKISAYDEAEHKGILRHVCIRRGHYSGEINVTVVVRKKVPEIKLLPSYLTKRFSDIKSVVVSVNPKKTNVVLGESQYVLYNRAHIFDTMCENEIAVSPTSFYQVNTPMAEKLYEIAADLAQAEGKIILDLYCGAGTIGLSMAKTAKQVIGVEIVESAVANARKNAERNGYKNAEFICADAGEATTELLQRGVKPDVVVVDPARQGCDKKALDNIASFEADTIVMISCNPATAARDCSYLAQKGYLTKTVQAVDLFSRTKHCECVVCLSREEANRPNPNFRMAQQSDVEHVLSLYQSAKNGAFCVWNDSYPSIAEIEHDLETKNLYVMTGGSKVIGAISVVPENELDGFNCWSCKEGNEIARVVIDKDYQGHGLSFEMVQNIESVLRENGCNAIHLSVVKTNIPAYKTYIKAGFIVVGEAQMYGNDYYLMEKTIVANFPPERITDECVVRLRKLEADYE